MTSYQMSDMQLGVSVNMSEFRDDFVPDVRHATQCQEYVYRVHEWTLTLGGQLFR